MKIKREREKIHQQRKEICKIYVCKTILKNLLQVCLFKLKILYMKTKCLLVFFLISS